MAMCHLNGSSLVERWSRGETKHQTLARELQEELDIEVEIGDFFYQVEHDYPDFHLSMAVYECKLLGDHMKMNVHKALKWVKPEDLMELDWAAADKPVAEKLYKTKVEEQER